MCITWVQSACTIVAREVRGDNVNATFTAATAIHLFDAHMCAPAFIATLSDPAFHCFKMFFLLVNNVVDGRITRGATFGPNEDFAVQDWKLKGLPALWSIAFDTKSESTASLAMDFITSLNQRVALHLRDQLSTLRAADLARCMEVVQRSLKASLDAAQDSAVTTTNASKIDRALSMLEAVLDESEEEARAAGVTSHSVHLGHRIVCTLTANILGTGTLGTVTAKKVQFAVYSGERMFDVKQAIATTLSVPPQRFTLVVGGTDITGRMLGRTVKQMGITDASFIFVKAALVPAAKKADAVAAVGDAAAAAPPPPPPVPTPVPAQPSPESIPAVMLAANDQYFSCLSQLMNPKCCAFLPAAVVNKAWGLVARLPTHAKTKVGLESLGAVIAAPSNVERSTAWASLLKPSSPHWLLYALQVVHKLLIDPHKEQQHLAQRAASRLVSGVIEGKEDLPPPPPPASEGASTTSAGASASSSSAAPEASAASAAAVVDDELVALRRQWQARFLGTGGLQHLYTVVTSAEGPLAALSSASVQTIHCQAASVLMTVFRHFFLAVVTLSAPALDFTALRAVATGSSAVSAALPPLDFHDLVDIIKKQVPPLTPDTLLAGVDQAGLSRQLVSVVATLTAPSVAVDVLSGACKRDGGIPTRLDLLVATCCAVAIVTHLPLCRFAVYVFGQLTSCARVRPFGSRHVCGFLKCGRSLSSQPPHVPLTCCCKS